MSHEAITLPLEAARAIFDALVTSMDFGSGFLSTEDVEALRLLGRRDRRRPRQGHS